MSVRIGSADSSPMAPMAAGPRCAVDVPYAGVAGFAASGAISFGTGLRFPGF